MWWIPRLKLHWSHIGLSQPCLHRPFFVAELHPAFACVSPRASHPTKYLNLYRPLLLNFTEIVDITFNGKWINTIHHALRWPMQMISGAPLCNCLVHTWRFAIRVLVCALASRIDQLLRCWLRLTSVVWRCHMLALARMHSRPHESTYFRGARTARFGNK